MSSIAFSPVLDLPLSCLSWLVLLIHFNFWAKSRSIETNLDLVSRLSKARIRVTCFVIAIVALCWLSNVAVWAVFGALILLGFALALLSGDSFASGLLIFFAVVLIREWSFGFPQLVLHPTPHSSPSIDQSDLIGQHGVVSAPLRPIGEADLNGRLIAVVSETGDLVEVGVTIIVTKCRNGQVYVRRIE